jgi:hypothetical protein
LDYSQKQLVSTETNVTGPGSLVITSDDIDYIMYAEYRCPDESQPDGLGTPVPAGNTNPIEPDFTQYDYARWNGTVDNPFSPSESGSKTSSWIDISSFTSSDFLTCGHAWIIAGSTPLSSSSFYFGWSFPEIGPVPWRASAATSRTDNGTSLVPSSMGGIGVNGNNAPNPGNSPYVSIGAAPNTAATTWSYSGKWEFSNNQSTVLASWSGRS